MKPDDPRRSTRATARGAGFTLLELLVVVGIIGLLAGLLLPALARARSSAIGIACLNLARQASLANQMYCGDHADALPYNFGEADTRTTVSNRTYLNWMNNVLSWEADPMNTNESLVAAGGLGPYFDSSGRGFRCPSDRVVSDLQRRAGWRTRTRTYSMNAMVGNAGAYTAKGYNVNNPEFRQFFRLGQIPEPARLFVFIEEHPDSANDAYFLNRPDAYEWTDLPSWFHQGGANLTYADGHAELHRWKEAGTRRPLVPDGAGLPFSVTAADDRDFDWLMDRTTLRQARYSTTSH